MFEFSKVDQVIFFFFEIYCDLFLSSLNKLGISYDLFFVLQVNFII